MREFNKRPEQRAKRLARRRTPEGRRKNAEQSKRWRERNAEKHRAKKREDYWNRDREDYLRKKRDLRFGKGASAWYHRQLEEQHGRCAICQTDEPGGKHNSFSMDHHHVEGQRIEPWQWRGLLCNRCNTSLRRYPVADTGDLVEVWIGDKALLPSVSVYLERWRKNHG